MGHDECLGPDVAKTQLEKKSPGDRMGSLSGVLPGVGRICQWRDWLTSHSLSKVPTCALLDLSLPSSMGYLWYFVEGTDAIGLVEISFGEAVYLLKGEIIKQLCNTYCNGVDAWQLEILKVCYLRIFSCYSN